MFFSFRRDAFLAFAFAKEVVISSKLRKKQISMVFHGYLCQVR
jgi:hypothetical protein